MTESLLGWSVAAVLLFWAVGAYNRLVRLRTEVRASFGVLDTQLQREMQLVEDLLRADGGRPDSLFPGQDQPSFWEGLQAACAQLAAALALARARPLEAERVAALAAAGDVLLMAWDRAEREDAHDLAGPRLPDTLAATRAALLMQEQAAIEQLNAAVARYNQGIAQFPALLIAWVFGFKPTRGL